MVRRKIVCEVLEPVEKPELEEPEDEKTEDEKTEDEKTEDEKTEDNKPIVENKQPVKKKRVMSEKQLDALKRGREHCVARLKEQGKVTNEKEAVSKDIKKIKQEKNIKDVEELEQKTEINNVNDNVEKLNGMFNDLESKINELFNSKKQKKFLKEDDIIKN